MSEVDDDIDDLVGKPKRSKDTVLDDLIAQRRQARDTSGPMVEDMLKGVTVSWLAQVFNMDPKTVKQKLADCPPLHKRKAGYVYHLPTACRYLIPPAISAEQYIKNLKPSELPAAFQQTFWDAALKRQKWEENAGQLWRMSRVRDVLGSTFQTIKFTMQLWADTLERQTGLTAEQRLALTRMVDTLQEDIYKALVKQAADSKTGPQREELGEMVGDPKPLGDIELDADLRDLV